MLFAQERGVSRWLCLRLLAVSLLASLDGRTSPPPIIHRGATCYLNSLLQVLYATPELRSAILGLDAAKMGAASVREERRAVHHHPDHPPSPSHPRLHPRPTQLDAYFDAEDDARAGMQKPHAFLLELQRLFSQLADQNELAVSTQRLTERGFNWTGSQASVHHDIQELNHLLLDKLQHALAGSPAAPVVSQLYDGSTANQLRFAGSHADASRSSSQRMIDLVLPLVNGGMADTNVQGDMLDALARSLGCEVLAGPNAVRVCDDGPKAAAVRCTELTRAPAILNLAMARFGFDMATFDRIKLTGDCPFPLSFDLAPFLPGGDVAAAICVAADGAAAAHAVEAGDDAAEAALQAALEACGEVPSISGPGDALSLRPVTAALAKARERAVWPPQPGAPALSRRSAQAAQQLAEADPRTVYDLVAVVIHMGTPHGGHYHALIRDVAGSGNWQEATAAASAAPSTAGRLPVPPELEPALAAWDAHPHCVLPLLRGLLGKAGIGRDAAQPDLDVPNVELAALEAAWSEATGSSWSARAAPALATSGDANSGQSFSVAPALAAYVAAMPGHFMMLTETVVALLPANVDIPDACQAAGSGGAWRTANKAVGSSGGRRRGKRGAGSQGAAGSGADPAAAKLTADEVDTILGRWFDFNDDSITAIPVSALTKQFGGRESAYLLAYRQRALGSGPALPAMPPAPEPWASEIRAKNAELAAQRAEYDEQVNSVRVRCLLPAQVAVSHAHGSPVFTPPDPTLPESAWLASGSQVVWDKRKPLKDLVAALAGAASPDGWAASLVLPMPGVEGAPCATCRELECGLPDSDPDAAKPVLDLPVAALATALHEATLFIWHQGDSVARTGSGADTLPAGLAARAVTYSEPVRLANVALLDTARKPAPASADTAPPAPDAGSATPNLPQTDATALPALTLLVKGSTTVEELISAARTTALRVGVHDIHEVPDLAVWWARQPAARSEGGAAPAARLVRLDAESAKEAVQRGAWVQQGAAKRGARASRSRTLDDAGVPGDARLLVGAAPESQAVGDSSPQGQADHALAAAASAAAALTLPIQIMQGETPAAWLLLRAPRTVRLGEFRMLALQAAAEAGIVDAVPGQSYLRLQTDLCVDEECALGRADVSTGQAEAAVASMCVAKLSATRQGSTWTLAQITDEPAALPAPAITVHIGVPTEELQRTIRWAVVAGNSWLEAGRGGVQSSRGSAQVDVRQTVAQFKAALLAVATRAAAAVAAEESIKSASTGDIQVPESLPPAAIQALQGDSPWRIRGTNFMDEPTELCDERRTLADLRLANDDTLLLEQGPASRQGHVTVPVLLAVPGCSDDVHARLASPDASPAYDAWAAMQRVRASGVLPIGFITTSETDNLRQFLTKVAALPALKSAAAFAGQVLPVVHDPLAPRAGALDEPGDEYTVAEVNGVHVDTRCPAWAPADAAAAAAMTHRVDIGTDASVQVDPEQLWVADITPCWLPGKVWGPPKATLKRAGAKHGRPVIVGLRSCTPMLSKVVQAWRQSLQLAQDGALASALAAAQSAAAGNASPQYVSLPLPPAASTAPSEATACWLLPVTSASHSLVPNDWHGTWLHVPKASGGGGGGKGKGKSKGKGKGKGKGGASTGPAHTAAPTHQPVAGWSMADELWASVWLEVMSADADGLQECAFAPALQLAASVVAGSDSGVTARNWAAVAQRLLTPSNHAVLVSALEASPLPACILPAVWMPSARTKASHYGAEAMWQSLWQDDKLVADLKLRHGERIGWQCVSGAVLPTECQARAVVAAAHAAHRLVERCNAAGEAAGGSCSLRTMPVLGVGQEQAAALWAVPGMSEQAGRAAVLVYGAGAGAGSSWKSQAMLLANAVGAVLRAGEDASCDASTAASSQVATVIRAERDMSAVGHALHELLTAWQSEVLGGASEAQPGSQVWSPVLASCRSVAELSAAVQRALPSAAQSIKLAGIDEADVASMSACAVLLACCSGNCAGMQSVASGANAVSAALDAQAAADGDAVEEWAAEEADLRKAMAGILPKAQRSTMSARAKLLQERIAQAQDLAAPRAAMAQKLRVLEAACIAGSSMLADAADISGIAAEPAEASSDGLVSTVPWVQAADVAWAHRATLARAAKKAGRSGYAGGGRRDGHEIALDLGGVDDDAAWDWGED